MDLSISAMWMEFARLLLGLTVAALHRPIADFILEQERQLVFILRQRGLMVPAAPTRNTAHNLYFGMGMAIALIEVTRIFMLHRGIL